LAVGVWQILKSTVDHFAFTGMRPAAGRELGENTFAEKLVNLISKISADGQTPTLREE